MFLIEVQSEKHSEASEMLRGLFNAQSGDYITLVDANNIVLIKALEPEDQAAELIEQQATELDLDAGTASAAPAEPSASPTPASC